MTREDAIEIIQKLIGRFKPDSRTYKALEMAIQALEQNESAEEWYKLFVEKLDEQKPCDNAIDREYLFKVLDDFCGHDRTATITLDTLADLVYDMPPVTQKPMECDDAISRKKAIYVISASDGKSAQIEALEQLPSVTQKSGKWERHYIRPNVYKDLLWYCSACGNGCGYNNAFMFDYCPNCGAEMESEDKE